MVRPGAPKLLVSFFCFLFQSFLRYWCNYHILMLSLAYMLFVLIISQPSADYPRARFVYVLLWYVHEKKFEKNYYYYYFQGGHYSRKVLQSPGMQFTSRKM